MDSTAAIPPITLNTVLQTAGSPPSPAVAERESYKSIVHVCITQSAYCSSAGMHIMLDLLMSTS